MQGSAPIGVGHRRIAAGRQLGDGVRRVQGHQRHARFPGQPGRQAGTGHHAHRVGVGQHESDPGGRVRRVNGQIGCASLDDGQDRDDELRGTVQHQPDQPTRAGTARQQEPRQPAGRRVEFGVAEPVSAEDHRRRSGVRAACSANSAGSVLPSRGSVAGWPHSVTSRRSAASSSSRVADGLRRVRGHLAKKPHQPVKQSFRVRLLEQRGLVVQPQC